MRVLVVDDDPAAADTLAELLHLSGYDAVAVTSGARALELAGEQRPDCALVDVRMPGMSGVELGRALRERFGGEITVIAMTGVDSGSSEYQAMLAVCDHMLAKPVDLKRLTRMLPATS